MIEKFESFKNKQFNTVNESKVNKFIVNKIYNGLSKEYFCTVDHFDKYSLIKYKNITITIKGDVEITWNDGINGDWDYEFEDIFNFNHFFDEFLQHAYKSIQFIADDTLNKVLKKMDIDFSFLDDEYLFNDLTTNDLSSFEQDDEYFIFPFQRENDEGDFITFNLKFSKSERNVYFDIDGVKTILIDNSRALVSLIQKLGYRFPCDFNKNSNHKVYESNTKYDFKRYKL